MAFGLVPEARLLGDTAAGLQDADVALDFVLQRLLQVTEGVEVFYFNLGAELFRAAQAHAYVGVAAERAFLHVAIADAGVEQDLAQRGEIGVGLFGRAHVRFGDDFAERRAAAVVVDVSFLGGLREAFVKILGGVFFQVKTRDADPFLGPANFDFEPATGSERQFVLRDLIALGQVRVEVILAGEAGMLVDRAVQRERSAHGHLHGAFVEHWQSTGEAETDGTDVGVWRIAEARRAAAKDLRPGEELDVDFQTDDRLIFRQDFGGDGYCLWSGFRHKGTKIIASADTAAGRAYRTDGTPGTPIGVREGGRPSRQVH